MYQLNVLVMSNIRYAVIAMLILSVFTIVAFGQGATIPDRGAKVGNAFATSDFEIINTTNGNLMLNFPLASLPGGRGEINGGISLMYNSKLYDSKTEIVKDWREECVISGTPGDDAVEICPYFSKTVIEQSDKGGWHYSGLYRMEWEDRDERYGGQPPPCMTYNNHMTQYWEERTYRWKMRMVYPDGSSHEMIPAGQNPGNSGPPNDRFFRLRPDGLIENCGSGASGTPTYPLVYYSVDGTYTRLEIVSNGGWTLYYPDGRKVVDTGYTNPQRTYDRNGNYIDTTGNSVTDQFGRSITITGNSSTGEDEIRSKGVGGAEDLVWKVKWKTITVNKTYQACDFSACPQVETRSTLLEHMQVVDYIKAPDVLGGNSYTFSYNALAYNTLPSQQSNGWGEVSGVTLPSGAEIAYSYAMDGEDGPANVSLTPDILKNFPDHKALSYDQQYDGASTAVTEEWNYGTGLNNGSMSNPDGSWTQNYFFSTNDGGWQVGLTYKTESSNGTKSERIWAQSASSSPSASNNPYVKTEFTSIKNATGSYALTAIKDFKTDKNGNVTEVREYDWVDYDNVDRNQYGEITGIPSGAVLKRVTKTEYYNDTPDASAAVYNDPDTYHLTGGQRLLNLVKSVEVQDAAGTPKSRTEITYDHVDYSSGALAGNPTITKTWDSDKGGAAQAYSNPLTTTNSISTSVTYNSYGMPLVTTDAIGTQATVTYGCIDGAVSCAATLSNLYPTKVETASNYSLKRTWTTTYDPASGVNLTTTDLDNGVTNAVAYDLAGRPTKNITAQGTALESWTQTAYDDINRMIVVKSDLETKGDGKKVTTQFFDQLGRVRLSKTLENAATQSATNETDGIKVQTRYKTTFSSPDGYSYQLRSNPYRAATSSAASTEPAMGWTLSKGWHTGKRQTVETFSGAGLPSVFGGSNTTSTGVVTTDIDANRTLVTDQAGKKRVSQTNALGQLDTVWEIQGANGDTESITVAGNSLAGLKTTCQYDILGNLKQVNQGVQQRNFVYSSLSRLLTAQNPEIGTINYGYDANGNLTQKSQIRSGTANIVTSYTYDALNRLTQRSYATPNGTPANYQATPTVDYTYDAQGRLTKVESTVSKTEYTAFDLLGRVTRSKQTTDGVVFGDNTHPMTYKYNLSGALIEQAYPSGRVVKNTLDISGNLSQTQSKKNENAGYWTYANSFTYNAAGAVTSMQLGNGHWESTQFNSRLQPTQIALGTTTAATNLLKLDYAYGTTANNGNVQSQTITVPTVGLNSGFIAVQNYTYDALNRLQQANEKPNGWNQTNCNSDPTKCWQQTFTYDRYGNRNFDEVNTTTFGAPKDCIENSQAVLCAADRKKLNPSVSATDNRFSSGQDYFYDTAGNTTADANGQSYIYDGENKMVQASTGSGPLGTYYYDGDGKRVKKVVPGGETTVFVYDAIGKMVAEYSTQLNPTPQVSYLTTDTLGSPRINTNENGAVISRHDYHPFGEEIVSAGGRNQGLGYRADDNRSRFTGYEEDRETELLFAQARYYSKSHGRFTSPDRPFADQFENSPQSWNLYSYVRNNPLNLVDPFGMSTGCPDGWPDCIEKDGEYYVYVDGHYSKIDTDTIYIDSGILDDSRSVVHEDKGNTLTLGEAIAQQKERREQFILNNLYAGAGHILGKIFNFFRSGKSAVSPTIAVPKVMPQFTQSTLDKAVRVTIKQKGNHIFRSKLHPKPHINQLANNVGGEEKLVEKVLQNLDGKLPSHGAFELVTTVNGTSITVRGFVNKDMIPVINTMF